MIEVDARGYSCPEPMMMAASAIDESNGQAVKVLVSTTVARDNVLSVAKKKKREAKVERNGDDYAVVVAQA